MITKGGRELARWRKGREITQQKVAESVGAASLFTISRWERGLSVPSVKEALRLERYTKGAVKVAWWAEEEEGDSRAA